MATRMAEATKSLDEAISEERMVPSFTFPDEATLIARGKYTSLNRERREQIQRVQTIVTTIITEAHSVLRDCQRDDLKEPQEPQRMQTLSKCLENLHAARSKISSLCLGLQGLEEEAWK